MAVKNTERRYDLEVIRLAGTYVLAEKVKVTEKQDTSEWTASSQTTAYAKVFGKKSYEIQLTGVDPAHKGFFNELLKKQEKVGGQLDSNLPNCQTYYYDSSGVLTLDYNLLGVAIEEISKENADPFDVKMSALKRKYE